jgi:hypothetical protein
MEGHCVLFEVQTESLCLMEINFIIQSISDKEAFTDFVKCQI